MKAEKQEPMPSSLYTILVVGKSSSVLPQVQQKSTDNKDLFLVEYSTV
jgi:hypothetical protein